MEEDYGGWDLNNENGETQRRNSSGSVASLLSLDGAWCIYIQVLVIKCVQCGKLGKDIVGD